MKKTPLLLLLASSFTLGACVAEESVESASGRLATDCSGDSCLEDNANASYDLIDDLNLDCSINKRVKLNATWLGNSIVQVSSCFHLEPGEVNYPAVADAYASILDANGVELEHLAIPEATKNWLDGTYGSSGMLWFYDTAYNVPGAVTVDLYLRGRSSTQFELIGSTDVPGTYSGDNFDYEDPNQEPWNPGPVDYNDNGAGATFERY